MGVGICTNCKEQKKIKAGGLCEACYSYVRANGKPRPTDVNLRIRNKHTHCVNCGVERRKYANRAFGLKGMCRNCSEFFRKHGRMRTDADKRRSKYATRGICKNCKLNTEHVSGYCEACLVYRRRYGKNRPYSFYREECSNCHVPLNGYKTRQGRCKRCQSYFTKFNKERSVRAWKAPHGWCDCSDGNNPVPATHTVTVPVHQHIETLPMCDDCYAEHQRQVRWYGEIQQPTNNRGRKGASQP